MKGLENYQRRGYRVALRFDYPVLDKTAIELLTRAAPNFVSLSADYLERKHASRIVGKLIEFTSLVESVDSASIMLNIDDKRSIALARQANFDLVQGKYFERPALTGINNHLPSIDPERARFLL